MATTISCPKMLLVLLSVTLVIAGPTASTLKQSDYTFTANHPNPTHPEEEFDIFESNINEFGSEILHFEPEIAWSPRLATKKLRVDGDAESRESNDGAQENGLTWVNDIDTEKFDSQHGKVVYQLDRTLTTVPQVWQEYSVGLNGNPSVKTLESRFGRSWRLRSESTTYYNRKKIYDYIENLIAQGIPEETAASQTEAYRKSLNCSLYAFQFHLLKLNKPTNPDVITYKMNRTLTNVQQVWQEYTIGINGNPSIKDLETRFSSQWRSDSAVRMFYTRRKHIYQMIEDLIRMGQTEEEAVEKVEAFRVTNNWKLTKLQSSLKHYEVVDGSIAKIESDANQKVTPNFET